MALLKPFRGVHYNPKKVRLSETLAPPYDVISQEERDQLRARSPYNMIHLILGQNRIGSGEQEDAAYLRAGENWRAWREDTALILDDDPAFYVYEQRFHLDGEPYRRIGLVAAVRLEEYENRVIFPHEKTFPGPKRDRLRLMETVNANLDSVFGLYDGESAGIEDVLNAAMRDAPLLEGKSPDGQTHRLWAIRDSESIERIVRAFESQSIVIADGHHRYETALNFRDLRRAAGDDSPEPDFAMMTLCSIQEPGLLVLPTHRLVCGKEGESPVGMPGKALAQLATVSLSNSFAVEAVGSANRTMSRLDQLAKEGKTAYGAYFGEGCGFILQPKRPAAYRYEEIANLSRLILDRLPGILEVPEIQIGFTHSSGEAICQVNAGNEWIAFLLQGLPVSEVYEAARNGYLMPEKSTFFFPKLQSGVVMRAL